MAEVFAGQLAGCQWEVTSDGPTEMSSWRHWAPSAHFRIRPRSVVASRNCPEAPASTHHPSAPLPATCLPARPATVTSRGVMPLKYTLSRTVTTDPSRMPE